MDACLQHDLTVSPGRRNPACRDFLAPKSSISTVLWDVAAELCIGPTASVSRFLSRRPAVSAVQQRLATSRFLRTEPRAWRHFHAGEVLCIAVCGPGAWKFKL